MTQRYGQVIGLKPDQIDTYERLHRAVWPEVLATIAACHISNYTIFRHETLLFAYFEYTGTDFAADMQRMADDPITQDWWALCKPLQEPLESRSDGEWWATMAAIFHTN